jgi:hypothetical protein
VHAIDSRDLVALWKLGVEGSRADFTLERFRAGCNAQILDRTSNIEIVDRSIYYFSKDGALGGVAADEAYGLVFLRYSIDGGVHYVQIIMQHDPSSDSWKYLGVPFWFVDAPLVLRVPSVPRTAQTVKDIKTWRAP